MKKLNTKKMVALLAALCLMTSAFVGGTLAKYTTAVEGTDTARVAQWGFTQPALTDFDLFDNKYDTLDESATVVAKDSANVIAPGTAKSETVTFKYEDVNGQGAPEVDYTFKVDLTATTTNSYEALDSNKNFVWTLDAPGTSNDDSNIATVAELIAAVKNISGDTSGSKTYKAGNLPTDFATGDNEITIGWKWTYNTDTEGDVDDTAMGNDSTPDDVTFKLSIEATQID